MVDFEAKIQVLKGALAQDSGVVIDTDLQLVERSGFWWCVLSLARPFFALFGIDVYSHVRIDRVAERFLEFCKVNRRFFFEKPDLLGCVQKDFLNSLTDKVSRHFQKIQADWDAREFMRKFNASAPPLFMEQQKEIQWPKERDKGFFDITEQDRSTVERAIGSVQQALTQDPDCSIRFEKTGEKGARERCLVIEKPDGSIQRIPVPYTLYFAEKDGRWADIFLITKKVIGKGSERRVRVVHSLFENKGYATKKVVSEEASILTYFQEHPFRGIVTPECFRSIRAGKQHVVEPLYAGSLHDLLSQPSLVTPEGKLNMMRDLVEGLNFLHAIPLKEMTFEFTRNLTFQKGQSFVSTKTYQVPAVHTDIKPGNILVRFEEGKWRAALTDFSGVWDPAAVGGTVGYRPPEIVKFANELKEIRVRSGGQEVLDHNTLHGRASDVWSMGLVLVSILKGESLEKQISPLPCIHDSIFPEAQKRHGVTVHTEYVNQVDTAILTLSQEQVDQDLEALKLTLRLDPFLARLVDEVIKPMLRIKPSERITAQQVFSSFELVESSLL